MARIKDLDTAVVAMPPATQVPASPEERRRYLLDRLEREGRIVAAEVIRDIGVSEDTIRRDLTELAALGVVQRVHGGALPPAAARVGFAARAATANDAKTRIGARAAELITPGSVVLIDSGTTALAVAAALPGDLRATIVTPSLPLAAALCDHPSVEVVMLGGRVGKRDRSICGIAAYEMIRQMRADLCLIGACGIDVDGGLTAEDAEEARLKAAMIAAAERCYGIVDTSKIGFRAPFFVAGVDRLVGLCVDAAASSDMLQAFTRRGLDVLVC